MSRHNVIVVFGLLYLTTVVLCGIADIRNDDKDKPKENENEKKKPNILKEYVCLRDGELCHPDFAKNRGLYVSCSNGIAWEQTCPKCSYHPIACPTRSLWFDGEKCEWASPKLASAPCIDRIPLYEINNGTSSKDGPVHSSGMSEQEALFQSLQGSSMAMPMPMANPVPMKEHADKNKWQANPMNMPGSGYFKSPKSGELDSEPSQFIDVSPLEVKDSENDNEKEDELEESAEDQPEMMGIKNRRKSSEENDPEFPTYLSPDDASMGSKIVRLSEPVYALVNSPNGSGKQVLMRVFQPFVLEDPGRGLLSSILGNQD